MKHPPKSTEHTPMQRRGKRASQEEDTALQRGTRRYKVVPDSTMHLRQKRAPKEAEGSLQRREKRGGKQPNPPEEASLQRRARRNDPEEWQPRRGQQKQKKKRITPILRGGLMVAIVVLVALIGREGWQYLSARNEYARYQRMEDDHTPPESEAPEATAAPEATGSAATLGASDEASPAPADSAPPTAAPASAGTRPFYSAKVAALLQNNADTVGWLDVERTNIHYPVVQAPDNEYYLTRTFEKKNNAGGAIFMDFRNDREMGDFNTIIYGHNMKDGSMFYDLREFEHQTFLKKNPTIELTLHDRKLVYRPFAVYQRKDDFDFMGFYVAEDVDKEQLISRIISRSEVDIQGAPRPTAGDQLLTLVTCTSGSHSWHIIVHAVLVEEITTTKSLL